VGIVVAWLAEPAGSAVVGWLSNRLPAHTWHGLAGAVLGLVAYGAFITATRRRSRRMLLLVIDDLDRCEASRVVRLLETVHTMLREQGALTRLAGWRAPARLGVLVLASGAWIRDAFAEQYATFDRDVETRAVRDLGSDFLQKIFYHSVLVPGLSPSRPRTSSTTSREATTTSQAAATPGREHAADLLARPARRASKGHHTGRFTRSLPTSQWSQRGTP
jgi:hypothetical protein